MNMHKVYNIILFFFISFSALQAQEICNNGIDDDNDGLTDLTDPDCACELVGQFEFIPNGDFELKEGCCPSLTSVINCIDNWLILNGSPDNFDPNCMTQEEIDELVNFYMLEISSSMLHIGFIDGFSESFAACTEDELIAGESYNLSLDIAILDLLSPDVSPSGILKVFGWPNCTDLDQAVIEQNDCNDGSIAVELASIDFESLLPSEWQTLILDINPTIDINAISFQLGCGEANIGGDLIFGLFDNISITEPTTWDYTDTISVIGDVCEQQFFLAVESSDTLSYQWYKDGEILVGETANTLELSGQNPIVEGFYQVAIIGESGCFYLADYKLVVPVIEQEEYYYICPGDSVFVPAANKYYYKKGSYTINYLDTISPCQILLYFEINVYEEYDFVTTEVICAGDSVEYRNEWYFTDGLHQDEFQTEFGCDSIYTLDLSVLQSQNDTLNVTICTGETYTFGPFVISDTGEYDLELLNQYGCDSLVHLDIAFTDVIIGDTTFVEIDEGDYYLFEGDTLVEEGVYMTTLTSTGGCDSIAIVNLEIILPCLFNGQVIITQPHCEASPDGSIQVLIDNEDERTYLLSIDGGLTFFDTLLFSDLEEGEYDIVIQIDELCQIDIGNYSLAYTQDLDAQIQQDTIIDIGDMITLFPSQLNFTPASYLWESSDLIPCDTCASIQVSPNKNTVYFLTMTDEFGCDIQLQVQIQVRVKTDVYTPTIFSPNGDGTNDIFRIFSTDEVIDRIEKLAIYDRWGNLVYEEKNKTLFDLLGWNGTFDGRPVVPGVYAYHIQYVDVNQVQKSISGSITLIR